MNLWLNNETKQIAVLNSVIREKSTDKMVSDTEENKSKLVEVGFSEVCEIKTTSFVSMFNGYTLVTPDEVWVKKYTTMEAITILQADSQAVFNNIDGTLNIFIDDTSALMSTNLKTDKVTPATITLSTSAVWVLVEGADVTTQSETSEKEEVETVQEEVEEETTEPEPEPEEDEAESAFPDDEDEDESPLNKFASLLDDEDDED